jgi:MFS family permease
VLSPRLWRHGPFLRFFIGASLSFVGDWLNTVAIAVVTYRLTGRVSLVALAIMTSVLPRVLLSPVGGALADRFERRGLLIALDCARAVAAMVPLLAHDAATLWLIYAAVLLLQAGACLYNPAQGAYVPYLVPDELLESANAAYASMRDIGMFVGPALAAVILKLWGPAMTFWGNALSFVLAAGLLLTLPRASDGLRPSGAAPTMRPRALISGYTGIVRRYPRVAALYLCYLAATVPLYFFISTMVVYAKALGQPTTFIGTLYAAAGLGGAVGALAMGQYLRRLPYAAALAIYALSVPLLGTLALTHHAASALALFAGSVGAGTAGDIIFTVHVQRYVAPDERGRAFGFLFWCIAIAQLIGASCGVVVPTRLAVPALLWGCLIVFPVVLVGVLLSVRSGQGARVPGRAIVEGAR